MSGITRYVLRQLVVGMLFVSIALTCILWLTQSLRFIEMIVNKGLSLLTFLKLTMLLLPDFVVVIIPVSLFSVVLFTYNRLIADRELVVLRAAGVSHYGLARPAIILAAGMTVLVLICNIWLIPRTVREFREMQWTIRNDIGTVLLQEGTFNKFGEGLTIYVRSRTPAGELTGILVHDQRVPGRPVTLMAERGAMVMTPTGPRVLMINGNRQEVTPDSGRMSLLNFDSYVVDFAQATGTTPDRFRGARERGIDELIDADPAEYGDTEYRRFRVELHGRLATPFNCLSFTLLATGILLGATFNRRGQMMPILIAVCAMVATQSAALGASSLATRNLAFAPLMYGVALAPSVFGLWLLVRPPWPFRRAPRFAAHSA